MALIVGFATIFSTLLGGLFGIRFKDKLHLILGFSAGAVIGVALFDLIPESIDLATKTYSLDLVTVMMAVGFILYMILDRSFALRAQCQDGEECQNENHIGQLGAAALCLHSFLDGLAIGLAFKVTPAIGWVVATAVLAHDFSDGINTVNMILKEKGTQKLALRWLIIDALAPALGVIVTLFFSVPEAQLGLLLAVFTGLFLYIGASDLIPESHHRHPAFLTTVMTILGMTVIFIAIRLAG